MTQDEIVEMAVQAGIRSATAEFYKEELVALFKLVAAKATQAEKERCAKFVDHILKQGGGTYGDAIRARGQA
jgi:hypothetical protein